MRLAFIGMMACGKSTISKRVASDLDIKHVSIDHEIEENTQMKITDIFSEHGEAYFRELETKTLDEISQLESVVIDCGGGIILSEFNMRLLKNRDFEIVFLNRDIEDTFKDIDYDTRPLLKNGRGRYIEIYNDRIDAYFRHADTIIDNSGDLENVYYDIIRYFQYKNFKSNRILSKQEWHLKNEALEQK
jgi:shikimate kinase